MGRLNIRMPEGNWAVPLTLTVAGSDKQVQYANNGALAAASKVEIAPDGHLQLAPSAYPIARPLMSYPATPRTKLVLLQIGNAEFPCWVHATGRIAPLFPAGCLAGWRLNANSTPSTYGLLTGYSVLSSGASQAVTSPGNSLTRTPRYTYSVTASTTAVCGLRSNNPLWLSGSIAGSMFHMGFGLTTAANLSSHRLHIGFRVANVAPTDADPSTLLSMWGFGYDSADVNWQAMSNDATGTATKVDLGASWPKPSVNDSGMFHVFFYQPWGVNEVDWLIINYETGAAATGAFTTDMPAASNPMYLNTYMSVGGVSGAPSISYCFMESWSP